MLAIISPSKMVGATTVIPVPCGSNATQCYQSLQDAYDNATAGDVLELESGTYAGGTGATMLTIDKNVTLRAKSVGQVVLDGVAAAAPALCAVNSTHSEALPPADENSQGSSA